MDPTTTDTKHRATRDDTNPSAVALAVFMAIQRECETVLESPELAFTSVCRIASLARQAARSTGPGLARAGATPSPAFATSA